jgi:outer membrane protein assembly factor BamB
MRSWLFAITITTTAFAQSHARGSLAGTNDHPVTALRSEPRVAWDINPGYRDSAGMVVSGNVVVTGNFNGTGGTYAYDLATGKRLWRVAGHIRGTPAVDATAAYAVNDTQSRYQFRLSKLDLKTGKPIWSAQEEDLGHADAGPILVGSTLVLPSRNRALSGYDAATGKRLWHHANATPCEPPLSADNGVVYFSGGLPGSSDRLTAIDPATGKALWSTMVAGDEGKGCGTVIAIANGMLFTGIGREIVALDAKTGARRWVRNVAPVVDGRRQPMALTELVISGSAIYTASPTTIVGFDLGSGRPVFEFTLPVPGELSKFSLVSAGGVMYIASRGAGTGQAAYIYALDLAARKILWRHHVSRPDRFDPEGKWPTKFMMPIDNGLIYENASRLVKLVGSSTP